MPAIITHDLVKAHISDLHRQAGRDALSRAARRARRVRARQSTPFMLARRIVSLIRRVLTLLGARKPSQAP